ncbi:Gaa1-domain-containing protein [Lentinula edodes]|nr:Gaa1-domain-containing protein [Lentinula edodes]
MDGPTFRLQVFLRGLSFFRPKGNPNLARINRRRALFSLIARRITILKLALFIAGYVWMLSIPSSRLDRGVYFDENALQPGQVNTYWNWKEVHDADHFLEELETLRDSNATSEQRSQYIMREFLKIGLSASTQNYEFTGLHNDINGTNTYAILSSPRVSGAEATVISASWISRMDQGDGTLNLRGVATVLALSRYVKQYSLWARDIIFIISDGYMEGMQAWLSEYHGVTQSNIRAQRLDLSSGVIWTALNIDYPGHSLSHLGIFHEGLNGRLPNQDLLNSFQHISRRTGVSVVLYDHKDEPELRWLPESIRTHPEIKTYAAQARNLWRHVGYQASGRGSGVHGLFHQYRIDAFTMFAVPSAGPHGFHSLGRVIESTMRTTNNLLERLHASFFFYVLTSFDRFVKIGNYLPSAILISVAMMFGGLQVWVDAAWTQRSQEKPQTEGSARSIWIRRRRPVLEVVFVMLGTHLFGAATFFFMSSRRYQSLSVSSGFSTFTKQSAQPMQSAPFFLCLAVYLLPLVVPTLLRSHSNNDPPSRALVLKAFNLCLSSTVISIITVLNFSLAACLAVALGTPLSIASSSSNQAIRIANYSFYVVLGFGWVLLEETTKQMIWNWDVLGVWLLPFLCIVYFPLTLQAALVCVI